MSEDKTKETDHSEDTYERVCMLCRRPESKVSSMISLPNNICICSDCMQKSFDSMNSGNINYNELINNMQVFPMMDFGNVTNQVPEKQRLKKKKPKTEPEAAFDIHKLPAPHKIKAGLDEYVIGQEHAKR